MIGPSRDGSVGFYLNEGVEGGDTVKIVLHIDPDKPEFDQEDVSREATVTGD